MELLHVLQQSWLRTVVVSDGNVILKMAVKKWNARFWTWWFPLAVRRGDGLKRRRHCRGAPRIFLWGGGGGCRSWPWGYIQIIFDCNNYVMKIMSKSAIRRPIRLLGKLKLTKKKKKSVYSLVCIFFNIPSAIFTGWSLKRKSCQNFDVIMCTKSVFY
jgi:hypothetical protein